MSNTDETFAGWCILELMGHRRLAGYVTEQTVAGAGFLRIDVPGEDGPVATQLYAPGSVYAITPTTEEIARRFSLRNQPQPVSRWDLPALPERADPIEAAYDDGNDSGSGPDEFEDEPF